MLLIGSQAMKTYFEDYREPRDTDIIATYDEFNQWVKNRKANENDIVRCVPLSGNKFHVRTKDGWNYEFEIAWEGSSAAMLLNQYQMGDDQALHIPMLYDLLMLKESHKYLKNNPHFLKTMGDIQMMRQELQISSVMEGIGKWELEFFRKREEETYTYKHPKLDVSKGEFFTDDVPYIYDHDSIHLTQALMSKTVSIPCPDGIEGCCVYHCQYTPTPAYSFYMQDGAQVMTDKEKFFSVSNQIRLYGVYEESCVLALERSQIPYGLGKEGGPTPRKSFLYALEKVCTSITSGWFRSYAWESYDKVIEIYEHLGEDDYIKRFEQNQHLLKPFEGAYGKKT